MGWGGVLRLLIGGCIGLSFALLLDSANSLWLTVVVSGIVLIASMLWFRSRRMRQP